MAMADLDWTTVQVEQEELLLSHTLPVGQTFRWVETAKASSYTGKQPNERASGPPRRLGRECLEPPAHHPLSSKLSDARGPI